MELNVLIRGQSNALLFADRGGAAALEQGLEARLGVDVHLLYEWGTDTSTIHSATAFMDWDTDGEQASLLRHVNELPADLKDNPTATVWMHNEYDQKNDALTTDAWLGEVRADAAMVRDALGQGADTTPYTFVPIRYPYGGNFEAIGDGMAALDADGSFNADVSWAAQDLTMDGDGYADSSHMGDADAVWLGEQLAASMAETLRPLANGGGTAAEPAPSVPAPSEPAPSQPAQAAVELSAGSGSDTLVLKISQDAYQGDAQYTVSVDGAQVGGTFTAAASRALGRSDTLTLKGDWAAGEHKVSVNFLNDAWGGTADTDRNLHVDGISYNGVAVPGATADCMRAGPVEFSITDGATLAEPPPPEAEPAPAAEEKAPVDWNALAAQAQANYEATGQWYI